MKMTFFRSILPIKALSTACATIISLVGVFLTSPVVNAEPPSAVIRAQSAATILVTVPANGKAVKYMLGSKTWKVNPGQTAVLPAAATRIYLPEGTILTLSLPSSKSMDATKYTYTVNTATTLDALTPEAIRANASAITPNSGAAAYDISDEKGGSVVDYGDEKGGDDKGGPYDPDPQQPDGNIKLPSGTIQDLINALDPATYHTINPYNVLFGEITDGN